MTQSSFSRRQARRNGWLIRPKSGASGAAHVHRQVKEVAEELTRAICEKAFSVNQFLADFREAWPDLSTVELENKFVEINWPKAVPAARATLAAMLRGPYDDAFKSQIMEALSLDATLVRGRTRPSQIIGRLQ